MNDFKGPIFVVGMPRSGTKLLRDLLNQHSKISIPEVETHFLPLLINKYGEGFDFNPSQKEDLFNDFYNTTFFYLISQLGYKLDETFYTQKDKVNSWESFSLLVFSYFGVKKPADDLIYGDKTPGYINHLQLLKSICPGAKFIHIIRDPRDYALSVRNIWNKNIYRAAYVWNTVLHQTNEIKNRFDNDYIEVRYEGLITDVENTMKTLSTFLGIRFEPAMCTLSKSAENYGDAKGKSEVVKDNMQKFLRKLSKKSIEKIETITFPEMQRLHYQPLFATKSKQPGKLQILAWKLEDAYRSAKFHVKEKGFFNGLLFFVKYYKQSSWRKVS
ncbi:MAG: sulfotransferase [Bacteroidetes bacterium]|nr:sulfotransferase [Bacteroidota bacterium]